jgi:hypothetical protein
LTVAPSGNTRGDYFDGLPGVAVSKNAICVGAGNGQEYKPNYVSNFGPTDDGRVKPDLCIHTSIEPNSSPETMSTSLASAMVSSHLSYLHSLYFEATQNPLKAATLKAILIGTCDQPDHPGPDFKRGWGFLNQAASEKLITQVIKGKPVLRELCLDQDSTIKMQYQPSEDTKKVRITIAWNDPEAEISSIEVDDTEPKLINDLDIRVFTKTACFLPFKPNAQSPNTYSIVGDNSSDNVEQILIESQDPLPQLELRISHKGGLRYQIQDFSLVIYEE